MLTREGFTVASDRVKLGLVHSTYVAFQLNIMQTKLIIKEIKFVSKATYESGHGIKIIQMFYPSAPDG